MRFLIAAPLLMLAGVASAQSLSFDGDCPGPVDISVDGLTPGGTAVFLGGAAGEGDDVVGIGGCSGTVTGLAGLRFLTRATADGGGMLSFSPSIPDGRCDMPVQVLDTATCTLTNVASAAGGGPVDCDPLSDVEFEGRCYYLDGSGGACDVGYELAPQSVLSSIAGSFVGLDYKNEVSGNCCIWHRDQDVELQDWGMSADCNAVGPFTEGPIMGGAGCSDALNLGDTQLTFCMSS